MTLNITHKDMRNIFSHNCIVKTVVKNIYFFSCKLYCKYHYIFSGTPWNTYNYFRNSNIILEQILFLFSCKLYCKYHYIFSGTPWNTCFFLYFLLF